jgi:hypothetical protein
VRIRQEIQAVLREGRDHSALIVAILMPPVPELININSYSDLPQNERYIFVTFGRKSETIRQGNRIIISVNPGPLSDAFVEILLRIAVESAKTLAMREGIEAIYVDKSRDRPQQPQR